MQTLSITTDPQRPCLSRTFQSMASLSLVLALFVASSSRSQAGESGAVRTQTVQLRKGWNAVFLEVQPIDATPSRVFAGVPVELAATFFPQTHSAAYIRDPGDAPWREEGWGVWYAPGRPDAFLSNLHVIHASQGYLIHVSADALWSVTGRVGYQPIRWQPDSYNFTGFAVDPNAAPTFETFFAGSPGHRGQRVYALSEGQWKPVPDPARTVIRSGEAYWVYCKGGSDFQGPIRVKLPAGTEINFGATIAELRLGLSNHASSPETVFIETMPGEGALPLAYVDKDLTTLEVTRPWLPGRLELPALVPQESRTLRLVVRREAMSASRQSVLLRVSNGQGAQIWVPVTARRFE